MPWTNSAERYHNVWDPPKKGGYLGGSSFLKIKVSNYRKAFKIFLGSILDTSDMLGTNDCHISHNAAISAIWKKSLSVFGHFGVYFEVKHPFFHVPCIFLKIKVSNFRKAFRIFLRSILDTFNMLRKNDGHMAHNVAISAILKNSLSVFGHFEVYFWLIYPFFHVPCLFLKIKVSNCRKHFKMFWWSILDSYGMSATNYVHMSYNTVILDIWKKTFVCFRPY